MKDYLELLERVRSVKPDAPRSSTELPHFPLTRLNVSQSLIKRILYLGEERTDNCPRKIYETYIIDTCKTPPSRAQELGIYFETKCIGGGAKGQTIDDLPRKKNGEKYADHERVDQSIMLFHRIRQSIGLITDQNNVQINAEKEYPTKHNGLKVYVRGTADVISPIHHKDINYDVACIDLKLAGDITNQFSDKTRPWLHYPWGDMEKMDKTQAYLYSQLFELPFVYLVFDYKKNPEWNVFPIITSASHSDSNEGKLRTKQLKRDIDYVIEKIVMWDAEGFLPDPSQIACKGCPVLHCPEKKTLKYF
jgi:hypothetical protein